MPPYSLTSFLLFALVILFSSSIAALSLPYQCNPVDKKTLLKIKAEFGNSQALASWKSSTNCCSWKRVTCDNRGHIFSLNIAGPNFSGPVPPSIGRLHFLSILIFRRVNLFGSIPSSFSNLTNLSVLSIRNTAISGSIPDFLGNMRLLEQIFMENNLFSGPIPGSLFKKLKIKDAKPILYANSNWLNGEIPLELGNVDFAGIDLSRNELIGDASFLFGTKRRLRMIRLSSNQLSFNMSGIRFPKLLEELNLRGNNIFGNIPRSIAGLKNLTSLDLSYNELNFNMSDLGFPKSLEKLNLSGNNIYGNIPRSITGLKNLTSLDLSHNQLCGKIPTGGRLGVFNWWSYSGNKCLCGAPLPRCRT